MVRFRRLPENPRRPRPYLPTQEGRCGGRHFRYSAMECEVSGEVLGRLAQSAPGDFEECSGDEPHVGSCTCSTGSTGL